MIEFVGLPGVGKSFLCRSLKDFYPDEKDARVRIVVEPEVATLGTLRALPGKLRRAMRFAATNPATVARLVRTLHSKGSIFRRGRASKLVNLLAETDRSARIAPPETAISEQGVLQAIWSLEMRSDEPVYAELLALLSRWLPDRVVFVGTERESHESRLRRRVGGRSHFDRLEADGLLNAMELGLRRTHEILDVWALHVREIDRLDFRNDQDVCIDDIVQWVEGGSLAGQGPATSAAAAAAARSSCGRVRTPSG